MSDMIPFHFEAQQVRVIDVDGEPWFVLSDLAAVLEHSNSRMLAQRLDDDVRSTYPIPDSLGRTQQTYIVSEAGLYEVIATSRSPKAKPFKRWVFAEVLPSIRKTGQYGAAPQLTEDQIVHQALQITARKVAELEAKVEADAPKVIFADAVAASHTSILVGELAKILRGNGVEIGANRLFQRLRDEGYLIRRRGTDWNMPTQHSMELGLFEIKETAITHSDGHVTISKTPKVTGKGQTYFVDRYLQDLAVAS